MLPQAMLFATAILPLAASWAWCCAEDSAESVDYAIVVTGSELLNGVYADGHTHFLTSTLRPLGLHCVSSISVDDKSADIVDAVRFSATRANLIIVTGGLGPTDSDITRETLSDFTKIALREHPQAIAELERRFGVKRSELRSNLRRQTQVPVQGGFLPNRTGTAVGLIFESNGRTIVALPGPPRELQPMVREELIPYLSRRFGTHTIGRSLTLRFVGIGQSQIDQALKDHITLPDDVMESTQFTDLRVDFTFSLPDDTRENRQRLYRLKEQILEHLGEFYYGDDQTTLEQHVTDVLAERKWRIALAEVSSGGRLAAALNTAADGRHVLAGAFVAPTVADLNALVAPAHDERKNQPSAALLEIARHARAATHSDWGMAVGEMCCAEGEAAYVDVAHCLPDHEELRRIRLADPRIDQDRFATQLLDQIRRMACQMPK